jgi:hypothetical protein
MDPVINLEAFNTNLHGAKILCQGTFSKGKPPIMDTVQKLREPFKKRILITNTAFSLGRYFTLQYDATFQAKDSTDWTMIVTYMTYTAKPLLVIVEDIQIPDGFWVKVPKTATVVHMLQQVQGVRPYDAIFFAPMEVNSPIADHTYKQIQSVYKPNYSIGEHKGILQEVRIANAGMAWTRVDEEASGSIFWYDPVHNQGDSLSNKQMSELFGWLSEQFGK